MVSFHLEREGSILFEMVVCAARGSLELGRVEPRLGVPSELCPAPTDGASLEQVSGGLPELGDLAAGLRQHFQSTYAVELNGATPLDLRQLEGAAGTGESGGSDPERQACAWGQGQLGELWVGVRRVGAKLGRCRVRGAFLGAPESLLALESSLVGAALEPAELECCLAPAFGGPTPLLGLGRPQTLIEMIVRASSARLS
jgi:hypothetical protein